MGLSSVKPGFIDVLFLIKTSSNVSYIIFTYFFEISFFTAAAVELLLFSTRVWNSLSLAMLELYKLTYEFCFILNFLALSSYNGLNLGMNTG
jgi:hypothetical protein